MADRTVKVTLTASVAGYIAGMDQAQRKTQEAGSEAEKLAQKRQGLVTLGTAAVAFGAAITGVGLAAARTGIQYNTLQQTTRAALTTLLGSAVEANAQMDKLDEFARTSPFAKQVFIQAQQQMLGFGVAAEDVIPALDAIQNAVAAMGGSSDQIAALAEIMARIKSEGRLSGDALQRLGYYGIDAAAIIGSRMNKTAAEIRDMAGKPGGIPVEQIWDPLVDGLQAKFGGAAANVKNTFEGAIDRVKAAWRDLSSELMTPLIDPNGGGMLVDFVNWAADVMRWFQALPEPIKIASVAVMGTVGAVALLGGTALLTTLKLAEMKVQLAAVGITGQRVASFFKGPWTIAIAAAAIGLTMWAQRQAEAESRAESFASTLDEATGRVTVNTRRLVEAAMAANRGGNLFWEGESAFTGATKLGIALEDVTEAALGNAAALERVKAEAILYDDVLAGLKSHEEFDAAVEASGLTQGEYVQTVRRVRDAIEEQSSALGRAKEITDQKASADRDAKDAGEGHAEALKAIEGGAASATDEIEGLADAIRGFGKLTLDARDAERQFQAAIDRASESVKKHGASLDINTEAGRDNEAALDAIAEKALAVAAARYEQTGSEAEARAAMQAGRDALVDQLKQYGITGDAAQEYIDTLGLIPANISSVIELDTAKAEQKLQTYLNKLTGASSTYAKTYINGYSNAAGGMYSGGVKSFAQGGFESGIYKHKPGGIQKFAEAGDEAFISFLPQYRQRNIGIWQESGERLGVWRQASPNGAVGAVSSTVDRSIHAPVTVVAEDPYVAADLVAQRIGARLAVAK